MNTKYILLGLASVVIMVLVLIFAFDGSKQVTPSNNPTPQTINVEGKQIIEITAKGGYSPRMVNAKADTPTVLRVSTKGTFDCSSAMNIPVINYQGNLPPSGMTDIEIPPQKAGTAMRGLCAMGMYSFEIQFN